ncbi:protein kinase, partial [Schaalia naturae]
MTQDINRNAAGTLLGSRYTLLTPIAQGGMGEVWKARDRQTGHLVAAKVMRPELSGQEHSLSRLRLEARNSMRVQHRNIAAVLDHGEDDGRGWIVMELVEGRPLTDYLRGGARLAVRDLIPLLMQVAMALNAAAEAGVVHRDIKPANILIRDDGVVKLTDFGISRTLDQATLTAAGMVMGTAQYLPPEQAMGETATSAGDLYALGVIAYECVAGHRPFTGATQVDIAFAHVNDKVPDLPADVPAPFAAVVMHLMEKDPARRPASGAALARELVSAAHALGLPVAPHPLPAPPGTAATQETAPHPVVPPVEHTPRRSLPPSLLAPVPLDEDGAPSARHG